MTLPTKRRDSTLEDSRLEEVGPKDPSDGSRVGALLAVQRGSAFHGGDRRGGGRGAGPRRGRRRNQRIGAAPLPRCPSGNPGGVWGGDA